MMLSLKYNFLFVHIAKTGGTSIRAALQRYRWRDPASIPLFLTSRLSHASGHRLGVKFPRHARAVAAYEMLPRDLFDRLFKFACVRNPWDLQVSSYHHIRRERPRLVEHVPDFESFIKWKLDPERPYQYHVDTSVQLQTDYLVDLHGNLIVDYVGHYENLATEFEAICRRIGVEAPTLPHKRKAGDRDKDYRGYYTDDTAALVAGHFEPDVRIFGYRFDRPDAYARDIPGLGRCPTNEIARRAGHDVATPGN